MTKASNPPTVRATALDAALGLRIRRRRKRRGQSQTDLADAVGITFQQIQKYERGSNRVSFSRLVDIAHALDCRVVDLVGDLDDAALPAPLFRHDTAHLREPGAPELMAAYAEIPAEIRRALLKMVVQFARAHRAASAADAAKPRPELRRSRSPL